MVHICTIFALAVWKGLKPPQYFLCPHPLQHGFKNLFRPPPPFFFVGVNLKLHLPLPPPVLYFNLISLNNQIQILFNDIKHYMAAKQYTLFEAREHKKRFFSQLFFACRYFTRFSMKMNKIFSRSMCTEGLDAGKCFSDF